MNNNRQTISKLVTTLACGASLLALAACNSSKTTTPPVSVKPAAPQPATPTPNINFTRASELKAQIDQIVLEAQEIAGQPVDYASDSPGNIRDVVDDSRNVELKELNRIKTRANEILEGVKDIPNAATNPISNPQTIAALEKIRGLHAEAEQRAAAITIRTNRPLRVFDDGSKIDFGSMSIDISGDPVRTITESQTRRTSATGGLNATNVTLNNPVGSQYNSENNRQTVVIVDSEHYQGSISAPVYRIAADNHADILPGTGRRTISPGDEGRLASIGEEFWANAAGNVQLTAGQPSKKEIFRFMRNVGADSLYIRAASQAGVIPGRVRYNLVTRVNNVGIPTSSRKRYDFMNFGVWADRTIFGGRKSATGAGTGFVRALGDAGRTPTGELDRLANEGNGQASYNGSWVATVTDAAGSTMIESNSAEIRANFNTEDLVADLNKLGELTGSIDGNEFEGSEFDAASNDPFNGTDQDKISFRGGFYGPQGQELGGVFDIGNSTNNSGAAGAFGGRRN